MYAMFNPCSPCCFGRVLRTKNRYLLPSPAYDDMWDIALRFLNITYHTSDYYGANSNPTVSQMDIERYDTIILNWGQWPNFQNNIDIQVWLANGTRRLIFLINGYAAYLWGSGLNNINTYLDNLCGIVCDQMYYLNSSGEWDFTAHYLTNDLIEAGIKYTLVAGSSYLPYLFGWYYRAETSLYDFSDSSNVLLTMGGAEISVIGTPPPNSLFKTYAAIRQKKIGSSEVIVCHPSLDSYTNGNYLLALEFLRKSVQ